MNFLNFNSQKCTLCGICIEKCPFGALVIEGDGIKVGDSCRMCRLCTRSCPEDAIQFEQKAKAFEVNYQVDCVIIGAKGTRENAEKLPEYGVDHVYVYEHEGFEGFWEDCYTDAFADCICARKPSSVLIGATALGRSPASE